MDVFISHGFDKRDKQGCNFIRQLRAALDLRQHNLVPFLDIERLKPGFIWREELHEALARCGAGIIVLSERSVSRDWVKKEAAILSWRRALKDAPPFRLHVIVFDALDDDALQREGLGPMQLTEIQAYRCAWRKADIDRVVNAVRDDLRALAGTVLRRDDWTPFDRLREFLTSRLVRVQAAGGLAVVEELAQEFDDGTAPPPRFDLNAKKQAERIAGALLRNCFGKPGSLQGLMERLDNLGVEQRHLRDIFEVLSSLWVDPHCAAVFHPRHHAVLADRTAFIALSTAGDSHAPLFEVRMLVQRANPRPAKPRVVSVAAPKFAEKSLTDVVADKVAGAFAASLPDHFDEDVDAKVVVRWLAALDDPIYVMMNFPLDEQQIEDLLSELPGILYIGPDAHLRTQCDASRWRRVDPMLNAAEVRARAAEQMNIKNRYFGSATPWQQRP